jgi:hypothetical protein
VISVRLVGGSLRLLLSGAGAPALRQEIEDAIIDAAPDLDDICSRNSMKLLRMPQSQPRLCSARRVSPCWR